MPSIGLSMIVKNGGNDLRLCLSSVRSLVSQIVIADTGSSDDTPAVAAEFGAHVISYGWADHFAEARNAALAKMHTDWILVLDADEEMTEPGVAAARELVDRTPEDVGAYRISIRNYTLEPFTLTLGSMSRRNTDTQERAKHALSYTEHRMTRLFRRHPSISFVNRIHEQVDARVLELGMRIEDGNFLIRHYGHLQPSSIKRTYYRLLGKMTLEDTPDDALAFFEAGGEEYSAGNHDRALRLFRESYRLRPSGQAAFMIANIHCARRSFDEALVAINAIPDRSDLLIGKLTLKGDALVGIGNLAEAREAYASALRITPDKGAGGEYSLQSLIESKLGFIEVMLGDAAEGIPRLEQAVLKLPQIFDFHDRLVKAWIVCKRDDRAGDAQERLLRYFADETQIARAAVLRLRSGNSARARQILKKGLALIPESRRLQNLLTEIRT